MSTEGIPTPRTKKAYDPTRPEEIYRESKALETELFLATRKLEQIRELCVDEGEIVWASAIEKILNS